VPYVEFSSIIKQGPIDILLCDIGHSLSIRMLFLDYQTTDCIEANHFDIHASVSILAWFDDPHFSFVKSVVLNKCKILIIINGLDMICLWDVSKWVFVSMMTVIVEERFKQVFF